MTYSPVTLTSGGVQNGGDSLLLVDSTLPASSLTSVLVVVGKQVSSEGNQTFLPLGVGTVGAMSLTLPIPQDGVYQFQAIRVVTASTFPLTGVVGDTIYYVPQGALYQVERVDSTLGLIWGPQVSTLPLLPSLGVAIVYLHQTTLLKVYNKLLLRYLYYKLGPLEGVNTEEATLLDKSLGRLERGLEGSKYLFQDQNYPEASRTMELLSLTRYL